jgi:hypothetical protein
VEYSINKKGFESVFGQAGPGFWGTYEPQSHAPPDAPDENSKAKENYKYIDRFNHFFPGTRRTSWQFKHF